jgi:hypothetical protein
MRSGPPSGPKSTRQLLWRWLASLRDVRERVRAAGWDACVLVNEKGVEIAKVMVTLDLPNVLVTTSAGELIGLLVRENVKRAVHEHQRGPS